jgi:hypothetical protein
VSRSPATNDQAAADAASKRAAERIRALQKESDALATQERTLLVDLRKLEVDRELKTKNWPTPNASCGKRARRVAATSVRAAALQTARKPSGRRSNAG